MHLAPPLFSPLSPSIALSIVSKQVRPNSLLMSAVLSSCSRVPGQRGGLRKRGNAWKGGKGNGLKVLKSERLGKSSGLRSVIDLAASLFSTLPNCRYISPPYIPINRLSTLLAGYKTQMVEFSERGALC